MDETIAYCGLVCQGCPIYWATRNSNDEKRRKMRTEIALQIKKQGGGKYKPQAYALWKKSAMIGLSLLKNISCQTAVEWKAKVK